MDFLQDAGRLIDAAAKVFCGENIGMERVGQALDSTLKAFDNLGSPQQQPSMSNCQQPMSFNSCQMNMQQPQQFNPCPINQFNSQSSPIFLEEAYETDFQTSNDNFAPIQQFNSAPMNQVNIQPFNNNFEIAHEFNPSSMDDQCFPLLESEDISSVTPMQVPFIKSDFEEENIRHQQSMPYQIPQQLTSPIFQPTNVYNFKVGSRALNISGKYPFIGQIAFNGSNLCHVCFLLGNDIFEYGLPEYNGNYIRRRNVGQTSEFNWNYLGDKQGITSITPDVLEEAIMHSNLWTGNQYHLISNSFQDQRHHNCHDFVQFCLAVCNRYCGIAHKSGNMILPDNSSFFLNIINDSL